jgi:DNA mismatch repair ATPase MutS
MDPASEYRQRLSQRTMARDRCRYNAQVVSYLRLGISLVFLVVLWLAVFMKAVSAWFIAGPALVFVALVIYHGRLSRLEARANRAVVFYERALERVEDRWAGKGNAGTSYVDGTHLYAADLDIFGKASLFELLCTARTRSGEDTLAQWLREPATTTEILRRQEAVEELRNNVGLREDLAVLGPDVRSELRPELITRWATAPSRLSPAAVRIIAPILVLLTIGALIYREGFGADSSFLYFALALESVLGLLYRSRVRGVLLAIDEPARELAILGLALRRMERETFSSARLRELQTNLSADGRKPSQEIAFLVRLVDYLNQRRNQFFLILSAPLLWATQFTFAIEAWRKRCGPAVEAWLENFGEFEALCALAGYAYEHPEDPFPEIVEGATVFEGEDLRHPLLPRATCVPNSVSLGNELQLLLVSGSNMSGKSTLLRTVGINAVLAQAGAPVRAKHMRLCVLAIGATLRIQDSLQGGVSRFYAEIQKLHDTMELTSGRVPVLFLLDEILHGTNSHDRAIGAEAIVRGLVERGAIGLVTTHDLALARVADALAPRARNVHFQDHLEGGRMVFDYRLRPGVVEKSNALELMRAVGLKV